MEAIVKLRAVSKDYGQGAVVVHALRGVDLEIPRGSFAALAGPSGSGKSTLLNILGGLDRPSSGTIQVDGQEVTRLGRAELARLRLRKIGFVFQAYNLLPVLTAYENAEYVLLMQGVPAAERRRRVLELLGQVGLEGLERRFPRELSGGQQQRVAIARAIAAEPALVLADEPTANVDSATGEALLDLMARLNQERGVTFLFSTHDRAVMRRARRLIRLKDGAVAYDGPAEAVDEADGVR
ncbi:MAG TPA: ABC transporter ATP-binding protein [Myxococcota bacterium]|nr:ABC transporter ATP-binding protein [Myxococcota bacterium]HRY96475.1 ABC transporter ATP-binding protein [Myxococcota bacterium]HSA23722.1 ABC transporter ATP-binding protein [Myxococcota bacterium]